MEFNVLTTSLLVGALVFLLIGVFLLIRFDWFKGWLIGTSGIGSLGIALLCSIIILTINSYISSSKSDSVATISFTEISPKKFKVELAETQGDKYNFELKGDLWEIDARILSWSSFLEKQGLSPYYRVNSVTSSFAKLADAEKYEGSKVAIEGSLTDAIMNQLALGDASFVLKSKPGSTGALPMSDGALFSIRLNKAGLISKPENQQAFSSLR